MSKRVIEIRPLRGGWEVSEMAEHLIFPTLGTAVAYSRYRLLIWGGEVRIYDATGRLDEVITTPEV
jgi:hypothetical protein